jgi:hypothetical protein
MPPRKLPPLADGNPEVLAPVSNGAEASLALEMPFTARVTVQGTAAIIWHRWLVESVEAKASARKGSAAKKSDDLESYVWRNDDGIICLPGIYLRASLVEAARYRQDPRSPRKSAMDLFKAAVQPVTELAPITNAAGEWAGDWDYIDRRRVTIQRAGITRARPALVAGWRATVDLAVLSPEYVDSPLLLDVLGVAGRLVGLADFRPTFGRFAVVGFEILPA